MTDASSTTAWSTPAHIAARLVDPHSYAEAHGLHSDFAWLRANLPVSRAEVSGFEPFWVVTKHADIAEISRQNTLFHNGDRAAVLTDRASEAFVRQLTGMPHLVRSLLTDGRAGASEVPRADATVVHEPECQETRGTHSRHLRVRRSRR